VGLLATFIVIAFFGIMAHLNRMVFGAPVNAASELNHSGAETAGIFDCRSVAGWHWC